MSEALVALARVRVQVKVCGVMTGSDAEAVTLAGADLLGFHFCPSLRQVTPRQAKAALAALRGLHRPLAVGVFMDQDPEEVAEVAEDVGLDLIQLHGSESPETVWPRPVMKALKVNGTVMPSLDPWPDPVVLDSWTADGRGGSGRVWDWAGALPLSSRRFFVAGGLTPDNVASVVQRLRPYGVDVSSGVESEPGRKDPELVRRFVAAVREASA